MKHILQLFTLAIIIISSGCKKELSQPSNISNKNAQFDSVIQFLKTKIPNDISKLDLESINILTYNNKNIGLQIFEKSSHKKFLLVRKDLNSYAGNWVDLSGLTKTKTIYYSGYVILENFNKDFTTKLIVDKNKVIQINTEGDNKFNTLKIYAHQKLSSIVKQFSSGTLLKEELMEVELPEIIVTIDDGKPDYLSLYWLSGGGGEPYSDFYMQDGGSGNDNSGGGGSPDHNSQNDNVIALPVFSGPKNPIKNLKDELKCFTVNPSSSYTISVNVNQADPNTRDKIDPTADFIVGHTFLSLEQTNIDGSKIVRNVGFYPSGSVYPGNPNDKSIFGEDSNTPYSVSLKISVSGAELNTVINTLLNQQSSNYELNNFNCVNSTAAALASIKVNLPLSKSGDQTFFSGNNPGDLGQDIRNLNLNSFSQNNGNRNIVRTVSNSNDQKPKTKAGTC